MLVLWHFIHLELQGWIGHFSFVLLSFQELLVSDFSLKSDENIGSRNESTAKRGCCTKREEPVNLLHINSTESNLDKVSIAGKWLSPSRAYTRLGNEDVASCHKRVKKKNILQFKIKTNCVLNMFQYLVFFSVNNILKDSGVDDMPKLQTEM